MVRDSVAANRSIAERWASRPRPERCWRCVETLRYAIACSMSKLHTTVCTLVVAEFEAMLLLFLCCSSADNRRASIALRNIGSAGRGRAVRFDGNKGAAA